MSIALEIIYWTLIAFCIFGWGSIFLCWVLFGVAWLKGWHNPDLTPIDILERLRTPTDAGGAKS